MKNQMNEKFKRCRTVGQLVTELQKLPKGAKLGEPMIPVLYNSSEAAKNAGLKPCVGIEEY